MLFRSDYAVVCEPSDCYVINAQAGYFFVKIAVRGKAEYTARKGPEYTGINAIGIIRGTGEGPTLMFNGHLDTGRSGNDEEDLAALGGPIPAGYKPKSYMKNGFVFGLGANNMKGGVTAAVTALDALLQSGVKLKGDVIIAGVAGESEKSAVEGAIRSYRGRQYQGGGFGTHHLMTRGPVPDYAVVCEPSDCYGRIFLRENNGKGKGRIYGA